MARTGCRKRLLSPARYPMVGVLCLLALTARVKAEDQPQWGERFSRNMVSAEKGLPDSFDLKTGSNVLWAVDIGTETHGTPVIAGGNVLLGTNNGKPRDVRQTGDRGVLMCFEEKTGRFLWQLVVPKITTSVYWDWTGSGICSPATVEDDRVYVVSSRGEVLCLDLNGMANGNGGPFMDEGRHGVPAGQEALEPGASDADTSGCMT